MTTPPESDPVLGLTFLAARIGDVLQDDASRPVPDGWHLMDGATLISYEWPDFVEAMNIRGGQFTLPAPERVVSGRRWLIKLGERRPIPEPPAARPPELNRSRIFPGAPGKT